MIDVLLLLEGSYPYVAGGVATWVHQLLTSMKDLRFGVVSITASPDPTRTPKFEMPGHVIYFKEIYLHDYEYKSSLKKNPTKQDFRNVSLFYEGLLANDYSTFKQFVLMFQGENSCMDADRFFVSREIWHYLCDFYQRLASNVSFIDFFWTWRATHLPLLNILKTQLPQANIYHAISTGYAGLLGAMARELVGGNFFLTEHGIYTHERMLEISQASWIFEQQKNRFRAEGELPFFKQWWIKIFQLMSRIAYDKADKIFTLYEGNKIREIADGAKPEKISIIPNGIDINGFLSIPLAKKSVPQVGLIGRVVNIKDVKTYIQAAKRVLTFVPDAKFYMVGPTDEEQDYYEECLSMVQALGLEDSFVFTGRTDVKDYYGFLDVVVLTSLSEAQPYVILEAGIVGIPVVATDVGACREMLEGVDDEDKALGVSGLVVEVSNPEATANAIVTILRDDNRAKKMGASGRLRVRKYYDQDDLLSRYLNVYEQNL